MNVCYTDLFYIIIHVNLIVVIIGEVGMTSLQAGLGKCRHLRVKFMPLAFTGIIRNILA